MTKWGYIRKLYWLYFCLILSAVGISLNGFPQTRIAKEPVSIDTFFNWPKIQDYPYPAISNDGKYVLYSIKNIPVQSSSLIIQALNSNWKIQLPGIQGATFTNDSRHIVFIQAKDSLCLLTLGNEEKKYVIGVKSFQLFMQADTEWLALQMRNTDHELILMNLTTGIQNVYKNVANYALSADGNTIVIQTVPDTKISNNVSILWINHAGGLQEIWKGSNVSSLLFNAASDQLAFLTQDSNTAPKKVWLHKHNSGKTVELVMDQGLRIPDNMELAGITNFSSDGLKLFIQLKKKPFFKSNGKVPPLNIWSYFDAKLQSQQLKELEGLGVANPFRAAIFNVERNRIDWIQQENESISAGEGSKTDNYILTESRKGDRSERYWSKESAGITWLVSVNDGNKKQLPISRAKFSPGKKYVIGYDADEIWRNLFVYEISTGQIRNITKNIPIPAHESAYDLPQFRGNRGLVLAGWMPDDNAILVYDFYDIWQIDPSGKKAPANLTHGRKKKWQFKLTSDHDFLGKPIPPGQLLLTAFNKQTKKSGFYQLTLGNSNDPEILITGDYVFKKFSGNTNRSFFFKARNANVCVVIRERCDESPNLFWTTDFKTFNPISNVYPEKTVNWYTSELINFTTSKGIQTQAILYKPDNFDSTKKYPLIIHYYDKKSDNKNIYNQPAQPNGELDIPWFASRGYLVMLTDIHYTCGEVGQSIYNSVVGAADYLSRRQYVDKSRIGIQGHSFGGYETNYLITHSNIFAAAVSSSGPSDLVSAYGNLWPSGSSHQQYLENDRLRICATPWERPDLYVKNSPIFYVGQVRAPILMVHNKNDHNVHFEQGLEFFTALRRAGKRAWMLEYDNGGHGVDGKEYKDYLIRMTQFFDHYLKGLPAPKWMLDGIPAAMKGIDDGLQLVEQKDKSGNWTTPRQGLLIQSNNKNK